MATSKKAGLVSTEQKANKNKGYSKEFKQEAVKMALESGSVLRVAKDLGISDKSLYNWIAISQKDGENAFPGKGKLKPDDEELWNSALRIRNLGKQMRF